MMAGTHHAENSVGATGARVHCSLTHMTRCLSLVHKLQNLPKTFHNPDLFSKYIAIGDLKSARGTIAIGDLWESCVESGRIRSRCVRILSDTTSPHSSQTRISFWDRYVQCIFLYISFENLKKTLK